MEKQAMEEESACHQLSAQNGHGFAREEGGY